VLYLNLLMLIKFSVSNFLSFKDKQSLSMEADSLKEFKDYVHANYDTTNSTRLLKSLAIHGHNSHGKSNLFKALKVFQLIVVNSFKSSAENSEFVVESFRLSTETLSLPSTFEIEFLISNTKYYYSFSCTKNKVYSESLSYSEHRIRKQDLFTRVENEIIINKSWNKENQGEISSLIKFGNKDNIMFLSALFSQSSITHIDSISAWFKGIIIINNLSDTSLVIEAKAICFNPKYQSLISNFINNADLGFTTYSEKVQHFIDNENRFHPDIYKAIYANNIKNFDLATKHNVYNIENIKVREEYFDFQQSESSGSLRYFTLVCFLTKAILDNKLIIVDEMDAQLHPILLEFIIKMFNHSNLNIIGSQLVFSSHNTVLLNKKLRRDQLVLIQKSEYGVSTIEKAHTAETPIRTDKSIEKEYLSGNLKTAKGKVKGISKKLNDSLLPTLFDNIPNENIDT
jgi:uncharacterized protein